MKPARESEIQRAILDYLEALQVTHWRCSLGGTMVRKRGSLVFRKNTMTGFPDIAGIIPNSDGRLFVIEVKRPSGRLSPEQEKWRDSLSRRGVLYILARSVEDVKAALQPETAVAI